MQGAGLKLGPPNENGHSLPLGQGSVLIVINLIALSLDKISKLKESLDPFGFDQQRYLDRKYLE